jgi:putative effector of murein hydrolase
MVMGMDSGSGTAKVMEMVKEMGSALVMVLAKAMETVKVPGLVGHMRPR